MKKALLLIPVLTVILLLVAIAISPQSNIGVYDKENIEELSK